MLLFSHVFETEPNRGTAKTSDSLTQKLFAVLTPVTSRGVPGVPCKHRQYAGARPSPRWDAPGACVHEVSEYTGV